MSSRDNPASRRATDLPLPAGNPDIEVFPSLAKSWPADGLGPIATLIALLPDPADLPKGTLVTVHGSGRPHPNRLLRWLLPKGRQAHPAVRCTALLARGYRDVGAAVDPKTGERIAWGYAG